MLHTHPRRDRKRLRASRLAGTIVLSLAAVGCQQVEWKPLWRPAPVARPLPPISDRIRSVYADASTGRFVTLADFESVSHAQIFRVHAGGQAADAAVTTRRSRSQTGAGALAVTLTRPDDVLICNNDDAEEWSLTRDWSEYHLFLASVHCPRDNVTFAVEARSGADGEYVFRRDGLPLVAGWNLLRFDLADMAESVDLADIRELRFSCPQLAEPVELFLDDLILTDNRKDILGSPDAAEGSLYVRRQGRRLHVGAAGRFELVFARGRIVQWFDVATDPDRRFNLAGPGSLGPLPLVVSTGAPATADPDDDQQWRGLGSFVRTTQAVVEASRVRVVVTGEWLYLAAGAEPDASTPRHRATYTVYPQGRIFTQLDCTVAADGWRAERVALAVSTAGGQGFRCVRHAPDFSANGPESARLSYAVHGRSAPGRADLLFAMHNPRQIPVVRALESAGDPRDCTLMMGGEPDATTVRYAALLALRPTDLDRPATAARIALDYAEPARLTPAVGRTVETDAGDADNDGFNEAAGTYVLQLDGDVARFTFGQPDTLRYHPAFKLADTADRNVWIYLRGKQLEAQARDADGNVIFQIPEIVRRPLLVEIHAAPR